MQTGNLEARPLQTLAFKRYCERLRNAQQHPNQVQRAFLYREAALEYLGAENCPELASYHAARLSV